MIGCDIVKISRFDNLVDKVEFLDKYFTKSEQKYINSKQQRAQTLAGLYAVKEALLKALKMGIGAGLNLKQIEIMHDNNGAPFVNYTPEINYYLSKCSFKDVSVSISHDGDYALAVCQVS